MMVVMKDLTSMDQVTQHYRTGPDPGHVRKLVDQGDCVRLKWKEVLELLLLCSAAAGAGSAGGQLAGRQLRHSQHQDQGGAHHRQPARGARGGRGGVSSKLALTRAN